MNTVIVRDTKDEKTTVESSNSTDNIKEVEITDTKEMKELVEDTNEINESVESIESNSVQMESPINLKSSSFMHSVKKALFGPKNVINNAGHIMTQFVNNNAKKKGLYGISSGSSSKNSLNQSILLQKSKHLLELCDSNYTRDEIFLQLEKDNQMVEILNDDTEKLELEIHKLKASYINVSQSSSKIDAVFQDMSLKNPNIHFHSELQANVIPSLFQEDLDLLYRRKQNYISIQNKQQDRSKWLDEYFYYANKVHGMQLDQKKRKEMNVQDTLSDQEKMKRNLKKLDLAKEHYEISHQELVVLQQEFRNSANKDFVQMCEKLWSDQLYFTNELLKTIGKNNIIPKRVHFEQNVTVFEIENIHLQK